MKTPQIRNNVRHVSSSETALEKPVDTIVEAFKAVEQRRKGGALIFHPLAIFRGSARSILARLIPSEFELFHHPCQKNNPNLRPQGPRFS